MVTKINKTLREVEDCIKAGESFIVEAGAGSGKTWTLIESIKFILESKGDLLKKGNQQIACITYTNVAKDEIIERIENDSLVLVLTIHEFLWHVMKGYQKELKEEILLYNRNDNKKPVADLEVLIQEVNVEYSQYGRKFEKGKITHEDVLAFSSNLFARRPKIAKIVANKFPFIFIDEYQDTEQRTIELLLDNLLSRNKDNITLGFFGDSMQKIYNQGVGRIPARYVENGLLSLITKVDNFRCSLKVINLLNHIRTDLTQIPVGKNASGEVSFIHCNNKLSEGEANYSAVLNLLHEKKSWNFGGESKILFLTHRGIANKIGYEKLLATYDLLDFGRDRLFNKDDVFSKFMIEKVENLIDLYREKNYRSFVKQLGLDGFKINTHYDKKSVHNFMDSLIKLREEKTVKEVLEFIFENRLLVKPIRMEEFESELAKTELNESELKRKSFYENLMNVNYSEFILFAKFINEFTPYSTKHGVKGDEFDNVLLVIDDNSWNQYKFNDVFAQNKSNSGRFERTRNLLYVCCSRAKKNLVVLSLSAMDSNAMLTINAWFGKDNVYDILDFR